MAFIWLIREGGAPSSTRTTEGTRTVEGTRAGINHEADGGFPGFTVTDTGTIKIIGAETIMYTHDKTGARVMHIVNEDKERAMRITFETPALDNKGIPHIFEHICLSGSQNYPSPKLFLSAAMQTYNTHMNASAFDAMTSYEYATMSEPQLLLAADYYLDSVFHPLLTEYEFQREAWRYDLTDEDAQLNVTGIVYNEMKGAITFERAAYNNMLNTLYPGGMAGNDSGGIPKDILTLTYEELVDFHRAYYHPSNALIFLYGDLDAGPFLEIIGSYCDKFDRKEIRIDKGEIKPFTEPATAVFEYPAEVTEAENNSIIHYAFNLGELSSLDYASFEILSTVLGNDSSPIRRKLREVLPGASTSVSIYPTAGGCCYLAVSAMGVNERDKDTLKTAVDEAIAEIMEVGFDKEHLEGAIAFNEFYILTMPESSGLGLRITTVMAWLNSYGLGLENWNEWPAAIEIAKANYTSGHFEDMVGKHIVGNPHNVLVATVPVLGLKEKLDGELRTELDAVKAGMSEEEIAETTALNKEIAARAEEPAPVELLNRLSAVTAETLPLDVKTYDIRETSLDGVKAYVAKALTGGLNITAVGYNSAAVTPEELHYLNLYAGLLGEVPTKSLDLTTLQARMARFLYNFSVTAGSWEFYDYSYKPMFNVQWYSVNNDYAEAAALVREMLINTDLADAAAISGVIGRLKTNTRNSINNNPHKIMQNRALASRFASFAYNDYMGGAAYHQFLSEAEKFLENDPEGFTAKLAAVRDKLVFKDGVVVIFAGNAEGAEIFEKNANTLLGHLTDGPAPAADLSSIPRPADSEGLVVEASVQYNVAFASLDEIGLKYNGKLPVLSDILSDAYLTPAIRYTIGAYGSWSTANRQGMAFISYRDPSVAETFAAYEGMAGFAADHGLTQEDVDRYIISTFSIWSVPEGELIGALYAMQRKYLGYPDDYRLNILREIKSVTDGDLTDLSKSLALAMEKGVRSTAGGRAAILENSGLYESIVYPFGAPSEE
ncbi:MAG: insulinase family protein [Deltaproteobacteria bacterium]|nr:insulinase family protein [Deltaproteobacteria bacterium]